MFNRILRLIFIITIYSFYPSAYCETAPNVLIYRNITPFLINEMIDHLLKQILFAFKSVRMSFDSLYISNVNNFWWCYVCVSDISCLFTRINLHIVNLPVWSWTWKLHWIPLGNLYYHGVGRTNERSCSNSSGFFINTRSRSIIERCNARHLNWIVCDQIEKAHA